jgi:hypothetical protein
MCALYFKYTELLILLLGHVFRSDFSNYISQTAWGNSPTPPLTPVSKITNITVTKIYLISEATYAKYVTRDSYREDLRSSVIIHR